MSDIVQGSDEWFAEKLGKVSSSKISAVMAKGKGQTRSKYMYELLAQRLAGVYKKGPVTKSIEWGIENESLARAIYELETGNKVDQVGFINHPTIKMAGASPDGLIDIDGSVEFKCPDSSTHVQFICDRVIVLDYQYEMIWQMCCTCRKWCDFVSYDPRMPTKHSIKIKRFNYSESLACEVTEAVVQFLKELDELEKEFKA